MTGDTGDFAARIRALLPARWFADEAPVLDALLAGLGTAWATIFSLLLFVRRQARLATALNGFLDGFAADFFGCRLPRRSGELDGSYRRRISIALQREHATRAALVATVQTLTGRPPQVMEPSRPSDTGAYGSGRLGYGMAGAWGSLQMPFQVLLSVRRPPPAGIATVAGYGTGGPLARADLVQSGGQVTDADIYQEIAAVMPTGSIAWTRITN